jgi:sugar phosphate isomerase/epimerase
MRLDRRAFLASTASLCSGLGVQAGQKDPGSLGTVIHSFSIQGAEKSFSDPVRFLDHVHRIGGRGIQVGIGVRDAAYAEALRAQAESKGMYLEGTLDLPRDDSSLERFEAEVRTAKRAGVTVLRTVAFRGRRYEAFDSLETFRRAEALAIQAIRRAVPVVERQEMRLAIENHKDWRADELIRVLKRVCSDHVGVCLDLGNSIALLEDPMEVVETLVPWTFTTHLKDMAVEEYPDGVLLSEVPLGTGVLDLARMIGLIRARHPDVKFNIEMITRDPLKIPCLQDRYWATFPELPGRALARSLRFVRSRKRAGPLPKVSPLSPEKRIQEEDRNVEKCLAYGRDQLGL